jgi:hypothetical protein
MGLCASAIKTPSFAAVNENSALLTQWISALGLLS